MMILIDSPRCRSAQNRLAAARQKNFRDSGEPRRESFRGARRPARKTSAVQGGHLGFTNPPPLLQIPLNATCATMTLRPIEAFASALGGVRDVVRRRPHPALPRCAQAIARGCASQWQYRGAESSSCLLRHGWI